MFSLKFETGSYFLKSIKRNTAVLKIEQIWLVSIQDPLWRIIRPTAMSVQLNVMYADFIRESELNTYADFIRE